MRYCWSEGRVVVSALVAAAGPRVGSRSALRGVAETALAALVAVSTLAAALGCAAAEAATASAAAALDLVGLGGGVLEGGADLVDVQLDTGAVLDLHGR